MRREAEQATLESERLVKEENEKKIKERLAKYNEQKEIIKQNRFSNISNQIEIKDETEGEYSSKKNKDDKIDLDIHMTNVSHSLENRMTPMTTDVIEENNSGVNTHCDESKVNDCEGSTHAEFKDVDYQKGEISESKGDMFLVEKEMKSSSEDDPDNTSAKLPKSVYCFEDILSKCNEIPADINRFQAVICSNASTRKNDRSIINSDVHVNKNVENTFVFDELKFHSCQEQESGASETPKSMVVNNSQAVIQVPEEPVLDEVDERQTLVEINLQPALSLASETFALIEQNKSTELLELNLESTEDSVATKEELLRKEQLMSPVIDPLKEDDKSLTGENTTLCSKNDIFKGHTDTVDLNNIEKIENDSNIDGDVSYDDYTANIEFKNSFLEITAIGDQMFLGSEVKDNKSSAETDYEEYLQSSGKVLENAQHSNLVSQTSNSESIIYDKNDFSESVPSKVIGNNHQLEIDQNMGKTKMTLSSQETSEKYITEKIADWKILSHDTGMVIDKRLHEGVSLKTEAVVESLMIPECLQQLYHRWLELNTCSERCILFSSLNFKF